jgi:hypothetical protein
MWGQRNSKYTAAVGVQLLAKIHKLQLSIKDMDRKQNHPLDHLDKCVDFMEEASDKLGRFINELNNCINTQDIQIDQLANCYRAGRVTTLFAFYQTSTRPTQ